MGSLTLTASGLVYVETPALIYSVERHPIYSSLLDPFWQSALNGQMIPVSSELIISEVLVMPIRLDDNGLKSLYESALFQADLRLLPITQAVLRKAAALRAAIPGLRTPDALHAATALLAGCTLFLTNDTGFRRVPGLPLAILDEVLAS